MVIRELAVSLGLNVDEASFAKGAAAGNLLAAGMQKLVELAVEMAEKFVENVKASIEYGDELHDTAQAMGVTTDALQELRYAASLSNMSAEELDSGLRLLSRTMAEAAKGGKEQAGAFSKIGVKVKDANGHLRDAGDVMGDIADHMKSIPDGAEKTALSMQLFGRAGARLIPLLNEGGEGLEAMRQEARDLGLVMGKDSVDAADELGDNLRRLKAVGEGLWRGAIAPLLPAIGDLVKQFLAWRKANAEILRQRLQQFLGAMVATVRELGRVFVAVTNSIKFMSEHWVGLLEVMSPVIIAFGVMEAASIGAAIASAAAWVVAAAPFIALAAVIAGIVAFFDDIETYKTSIERGGTGKNTVFGRYKQALDEWLKPNANDPWWLKAIKDLVAYMEEALGLKDRLFYGEGGKKQFEKDSFARNAARVNSEDAAEQERIRQRKISEDVYDRYGAVSGIGHQYFGTLPTGYEAPQTFTAPVAGSSSSSANTTNHTTININGGDLSEVRRVVGQTLDERGVVDSSALESTAAAAPASY